LPSEPADAAYVALWRELTAGIPETSSTVWLYTSTTADRPNPVLLKLALAAADQGPGQVCLVDADPRRHTLANQLGLPCSPGLREVLQGEATLETALHSTAHPRLHALMAGQVNGSKTGPIGPAVHEVLRQLREQFRWTLVDAPGWRSRADVIALASFCDAVYVVADAGEARQPEINALLELIREQGCCPRGCLILAE
jgi:Mrp family chromosome partitioning ATPase